jgi:transcriptional regulator GlxA family with amidase domain
MCAFHSRAGRNAASCAISNGSKVSVTGRGANSKNDDVISSARPAWVQDVRLRKLLDLIDSDPLGKIHDWAVALNLSPSHLQHLFKQATGLGLGHLLTEKRLQKAASLLSSTNLSIKEIACAVGYEHASSFTRAFERRFDKGPRNYRTGNGSQEMLINRRAS